MSSFNPKPEAMAGDACGPSIPLPANASGFGLNEPGENDEIILMVVLTLGHLP